MKNIQKILSLCALVLPLYAHGMDKSEEKHSGQKPKNLTVEITDSIPVSALVTTAALVEVASNPNLDRTTKSQLLNASFRNSSPNSKRRFLLDSLTFLSTDLQGLIQIQTETTNILNRQLLQSTSASNSKSNSPVVTPANTPIETQSIPATILTTSATLAYMKESAPTPKNIPTSPILDMQTLSTQSPTTRETTLTKHMKKVQKKKKHHRSSSAHAHQKKPSQDTSRPSGIYGNATSLFPRTAGSDSDESSTSVNALSPKNNNSSDSDTQNSLTSTSSSATISDTSSSLTNLSQSASSTSSTPSEQ